MPHPGTCCAVWKPERPADVLLSADTATMDAAVAKKQVMRRQPDAPLPATSWSWAVPAGQSGPDRRPRRPDPGRRAPHRCRQPRIVPAGRYAKRRPCHDKALWFALTSKLVYYPSVRHVPFRPGNQQVDAGFIYRTRRRTHRQAVAIVATIPLKPPVTYVAARATTSHAPKDAAAFVALPDLDRSPGHPGAFRIRRPMIGTVPAPRNRTRSPNSLSPLLWAITGHAIVPAGEFHACIVSFPVPFPAPVPDACTANTTRPGYQNGHAPDAPGTQRHFATPINGPPRPRPPPGRRTMTIAPSPEAQAPDTAPHCRKDPAPQPPVPLQGPIVLGTPLPTAPNPSPRPRRWTRSHTPAARFHRPREPCPPMAPGDTPVTAHATDAGRTGLTVAGLPSPRRGVSATRAQAMAMTPATVLGAASQPAGPPAGYAGISGALRPGPFRACRPRSRSLGLGHHLHWPAGPRDVMGAPIRMPSWNFSKTISTMSGSISTAWPPTRPPWPA